MAERTNRVQIIFNGRPNEPGDNRKRFAVTGLVVGWGTLFGTVYSLMEPENSSVINQLLLTFSIPLLGIPEMVRQYKLMKRKIPKT